MQSHSINVGILTRLFKEKQRKKFEAQCKLTVYFPDKVIIKETIAPEKQKSGKVHTRKLFENDSSPS